MRFSQKYPIVLIIKHIVITSFFIPLFAVATFISEKYVYHTDSTEMFQSIKWMSFIGGGIGALLTTFSILEYCIKTKNRRLDPERFSKIQHRVFLSKEKIDLEILKKFLIKNGYEIQKEADLRITARRNKDFLFQRDPKKNWTDQILTIDSINNKNNKIHYIIQCRPEKWYVIGDMNFTTFYSLEEISSFLNPVMTKVNFKLDNNGNVLIDNELS